MTAIAQVEHDCVLKLAAVRVELESARQENTRLLAEIDSLQSVKDATEKMRSTLLHFTRVVIELEEKYRLPLESARQDTERLRAALTAAINSLRPIVDCGVTDRTCLACREDVKALFGKLAEFDATRGVQGNVGEPKRD